ncbi:pyocin knob domain-containing protein [Leclercia adecarboxylata]
MKSAGAFPCRAATLNKPTGVTQGGWLFVTDHVAAGNILQIYHTATTAPADQANRRYTRTFNGTVWSGWKLLGGTDALNDLGYGLTASSRITSFDWQQADFLTGSMQTFVFSSSLNPPSGVSYNTNTTVTATTIQKNSNAAVIKLNSLSASNGDKSEYIIVVTGTAGSRSFNVVRSYNSDSSTVIPVANGGTGAKTPTDARNAISASVGGVTVSGAFSNIISVDPGFYSINGGNFSDPANGDFGSLFSAGTYGSGLNGQIFIRNDGTSLLYRGGSNATVRTVYSTANTTVDSNGFIKKSSPVSNIFSDGRCINNDESEGVTVTRQAVGVYLLEGCMGLNADAAWGGIDGGFEIPLDRNKQPRIWLDYEVSQDGSVLVKTYHRTHPSAPKFARNECEGIADGDPVDIPADSFISVRIEMPEDSIYNKKMEEAAQKLAEEEADRIRAEQERQKTEVDPKEQPDVQH